MQPQPRKRKALQAMNSTKQILPNKPQKTSFCTWHVRVSIHRYNPKTKRSVPVRTIKGAAAICKDYKKAIMLADALHTIAQFITGQL
jgi:hypothetical protein